MVARVIQAVVKEGMMDDVVRIVDEELGPRALEREGMRKLLLLTHKGTGQAIAVALWESQEKMDDSTGFLEGQLEQVLPMLEEAASIRTFQVSAQI